MLDEVVSAFLLHLRLPVPGVMVTQLCQRLPRKIMQQSPVEGKYTYLVMRVWSITVQARDISLDVLGWPG